MKTITWNDFEQVELRIGTIVSAEVFKQAHKPAYKLQVDFGEELGIKKSSAQITDLYSTDDLIGKQVLAVVNFPPKQIGPMMSECLVTGFYNDQDAVILAVPDKPCKNGVKLA
ncbi:MAG: tRNA-binding protein [Proteobacteria bacterium]|nr:tRNA-binding protein [Pseudomonadota bacterium]